MTQTVIRVAMVAVLAGLVGCTPPTPMCVEGDEPVCDAGALPSDSCDSIEQARMDTANCALTLCQDKEAFISTLADGGDDIDFYTVTLPGNLTARSLLTVSGGYGGVPQTAVNFSVNVLRTNPDGGFGAVATGVDRRSGAGAPKNVEISQPFSESNAALIVRVSDIGGVSQPRVDNLNAYRIKVCTLENPDMNEPNDTTPTAITLMASAGVQRGTQSGYLATANDVDLYSFPVSGARQIIYVHITSAMTSLMPALAYRMSYVLKNPMGGVISEGVMDNEFLQVDLSTARLTAGDGTYLLEVSAYKLPQQMTPAPGDVRLKYDVEVRVMPDVDMLEGSTGNDGPTTARATNLAVDSPTTLTGKISYVPDMEWFRLTFPASGSPRTLRYELLPPGGGGRFPPLTTVATRQIRVAQEVTLGANNQDRQNNCINNATVCPRSFDDPNKGDGLLVSGVCRSPGIDPPHCLLAERNEEYQIPSLRSRRNFVGAIPVPAGVSSMLLSYGDTGKGRLKFADDNDWSIRVTLESDPDEAGRPANGAPQPMAVSNVNGAITFGYGKLIQFDDLNMAPGIRGPKDYDATDTDSDTYLFSVGGAGDHNWQFEYTVGYADGGSRPAGTLAFEITMCQGPVSGNACPGQRGIIYPDFGSFAPWYLPLVQGNERVHFTQMQQGNSVVIRAEPVACYCVPASTAAAGGFLLSVVAVDRTSNDPIPYSIRQSAPAFSCPGAVQDGGAMPCGFLLR